MTEIVTINPATGHEIDRHPVMSFAEIEEHLAGAHEAQPQWAAAPARERAAVLRSVAKELRGRRDELARLATVEMGKPITESAAEIDKCAWVCDHYAEHGPSALEDRPVETERTSWVSHEPMGTVLAVMPWNFPFWQAFRFAAPALVAGNAGLLKHAPNVTGCALAIGDVLRSAGVPDGVFGVLVVAAEHVPSVVDDVVSDPRVAAVTVTGSARAGCSRARAGT